MERISRKAEMYIQALYALKKSYTGNTVDGVHRTGRMIFKKAIEKDLIRKDPRRIKGA
ncbi:hypothetical protein SAMN05518848_106112 [Paenibacillus sp. PDC88]|nr:hypothetical protein SAMN05518848_106112 [Paenibacillus sp. PDC88]